MQLLGLKKMIIKAIIPFLCIALGSCIEHEVNDVKGNNQQYQIWIWTGGQKYAGTDATVFVNISGLVSSTGEIKLDSNGDNFERGSLDIFTIVQQRNLGPIKQIYVRHDNGLLNPGWFIKKIKVLEPNGNFVTFPAHTWLDKDQGDGKIARILYPKIQDLCGLRGGAPASSRMSSVNSSPWQATVHSPGGIYGGILMQPSWVLTTATFAQYKGPLNFTSAVHLGDYSIDKKEKGEQIFFVTKIFVHPNYNATSGENNLALLQLDHPASLSYKVNVPCFPPQGYRLLPEHQCYRSGFQQSCSDNDKTEHLQEEKLINLRTELCVKDSKKHGVRYDPKTMLCAAREHQHQCAGRSGDPLVCGSIENLLYVQGMSTETELGCKGCLVSYFIRIPEYMKWIESIMFVE